MCISNYGAPVFVDDVLGGNLPDIVCIYILCVVIIQIFKPLIKTNLCHLSFCSFSPIIIKLKHVVLLEIILMYFK